MIGWEEQAAGSTRRNGPRARGGGARVLVVDDDPAGPALVRRILEPEGYEVDALDGGEGVLAYVRARRPDVVLLDVHMPGRDGAAVLAELRRLVPGGADLPVVVLTADDARETRRMMLTLGATDFLTGPVDPVELRMRVRHHVEVRRAQRDLEAQNAALAARVGDARERQAARAATAHRVHGVLVAGGPTMVFQPVVDLGSGEVVGAEALARFPGDPATTPDRWFARAVEVGLGADLELAAVRNALAALPAIPDGLFLSVNLSPATLPNPGLADLLAGVDGRRVVLELTEHARVADYRALRRALRTFRAAGVRLGVDDLGAGYAGFRHVLNLHPEVVKIDVSIIRGIEHDPVRQALTRALAQATGELDGVVVAEGIESAVELDALRALGVPWGQGYALGAPGPLPLPVAVAR